MSDLKIYSNIFIYKIYCRDAAISHIYIGSTNNMYRRWSHHKSTCNNPKACGYNWKLYDFIRKNGGIDNWDIVVIYTKENVTKKERVELEKYYYNVFNPLLNSYKVGRTHKEYLKDNYDKIMLQRAGNRLKHIEKRRAMLRKRYYDNKEQFIQNSKNFYSKNKEQIKAKNNSTFNCLCGATLKYGNRKQHILSANHKTNLQKIFSCIEINE